MKPGKIIIIYSFIVCLILTVVGIISAKNTSQLLSSFIFLPLIFFFGIKLLQSRGKSSSKIIKRKPATAVNNAPVVVVQESAVEQVTEPEVITGVPDNNKRLFLKLIGSAGFSLLLMALFTKKAQASFFGSAPTGPGTVSIKDIAGNKIDPAEKKPTDGYEITNIDDAGTPAYYGFMKKTGEWYIMQNSSNAFRYAKGNSDFVINWGVRGTLTYDYFNTVFG